MSDHGTGQVIKQLGQQPALLALVVVVALFLFMGDRLGTKIATALDKSTEALTALVVKVESLTAERRGEHAEILSELRHLAPLEPEEPEGPQ